MNFKKNEYNDKETLGEENISASLVGLAVDYITRFIMGIELSEAFKNMKEMSGKTTKAITGVTILDLYQNKEICFADVTEVKFNQIEDDEIQWYVDNEFNLLNISGHAILGKASLFVDKLIGDHNTLFGISPSKVYIQLKKIRI